MKYKIGDVVKVRNDLQVGKKYGTCRVTEGMLKYRGTTHIIEYIDPDGDLCLDDNTPYVWNKDMVELVKAKNDLEQSNCVEKIKEKNNMNYKVGDTVKIRNDLQVGEKYGNCNVLDTMLRFRGAIDTIEKIDDDGDFYLTNENNHYSWNKDMLELVEAKKDLEQSTVKKDLEQAKKIKLAIYRYLLNDLEETYKAETEDYGNSVANTYEKFGDMSFLIHITDKYNRLLALYDPNATQQLLKDEKIEDTILDLINYCLLWLVEREYKNQ